MLKKISYFITLFLILSFNYAFALDFSKNSSINEVKQMIRAHENTLIDKKFDDLKNFYSEDFISSDGFKVDEIIDMYKNATDAFENMKYKTKIKSVKADENWAVVEMDEKTTAKLYPNANKNKMGKLDSESSYVLYLKKEQNQWKILKDEVKYELTSLKYGSARNVKIDFLTPMFVQNNQEYDLVLKINKPKDVIALASISNEEINYPAKNYEEKFRKTSPSGDLERLVKSNDKNRNEYALASVGLTKISLNKKQKKVRIELTGIAYIVKRVNMFGGNNQI